MNKKQVKRFVRKILVKLKGYEVPIKYFYGSDDTRIAYLKISLCDDNFLTLFLNNKYIRNLDPITLKVTLLHEIGHIENSKAIRNKGFKSEYHAQKWAIKRANQLGMYKIARRAKKMLTEDWQNASWFSSERIYRMASSYALRK